ncbi:ketoacyl-synthetase C-terminal extension domain-containing protein, partial [Streptomyces lonarensis]|uniref:ketoacyl-synthetase C-terminal extension domain-containing protein n=1 Tax=Streptomyces lonarensis TaxID=700599 RepID=UPI0030C70B0F
MAGIIKMVLAMRHGVLPRTLHADTPSTHVDWTTGNVQLLEQAQEWPAGERLRRAGVSAFGVSGTNAHVIIEEAPEPTEAAEPDRQPGEEPALPVLADSVAVVPWPVSGQSAVALTGQAGRLREHVVARPGVPVGDVAWSLATTRSVFEHRAVVLGAGREGLVAGLAAVAT